MKKRHLYLALILGAAVLWGSCKRKHFDNYVGPTLCASDAFAYLSQPALSSTTPDLSTGPLVLTATFNESVPWDITIAGTVSGAYKKLSGRGESINVNWYGNPDSMKFFQAEPCVATFKVACKDPIVINFTITGKPTFDNNPSEWAMVYDADNNGMFINPTSSYGNPTFTHVRTTPNNTTTFESPQGGDYFKSTGTSASPVYYFCGYDLTFASASPPSANLAALMGTSNPEEVYFNCFVNYENTTGSAAVADFLENGVHKTKTLVTPQATVAATGWQYYSFKLSEANINDLALATNLSFSLNAYPNQGTSGLMAIDFIILTKGKPFIPSAVSGN